MQGGELCASSNEPLITIIHKRVIEKVLKSIIKQDFPLSRVRSIIVDGSSRDNKLR